MKTETKTYTIDVDYEFGPIETYIVEARSSYEACKKAKAKYARDYFKKSYMKTYIYK